MCFGETHIVKWYQLPSGGAALVRRTLVYIEALLWGPKIRYVFMWDTHCEMISAATWEGCLCDTSNGEYWYMLILKCHRRDRKEDMCFLWGAFWNDLSCYLGGAAYVRRALVYFEAPPWGPKIRSVFMWLKYCEMISAATWGGCSYGTNIGQTRYKFILRCHRGDRK